MNNGFNLDEEVRCDFVVTKERKALWNVEMDLFDQLDRICRENNIRYYAAGGTLLGAVRHQGFIPWDDDMDFFMPFDDYQRFCRIAPGQLNKPYFLQNYKTTSDCTPRFARIRNSNTTGCTVGEYDVVPPHNVGIFIDIFPLFYVPTGKAARKLQTLKIRILGLANAGHMILQRKRFNKTLKFKDYCRPHVLTWLLLSPFMNHEKCCEAFLKACDYRKVKKLLGLSSFLTGKEKYIWNAEWFDDVVRLPFENRFVDCPKHYHEALAHQFGDYMKFVRGAAIHTMGTVDTETPYWITFSDRFGNNYS